MSCDSEEVDNIGLSKDGMNSDFIQQLLGVLLLPVVFLASWIWLLFKFLQNPVAFVNRQSRKEYKAPDIPEGLSSEYVEVNGIVLHTVQGGDKNAPLMIFLHGFPEFWFSWRHQLKEFSKKYFVVAIDMRGYNLSDKPVGMSQYGMDIVASDVAEVVEVLGYKNCILVGHDWGGVIAQTTACNYPQLVSKLVIIASANFKLLMLNRKQNNLWKMKHLYFFRMPWVPEIMISIKNFQFIRGVMTPGGKVGPLYPHANSVEEVEFYASAIATPGALSAALNYYRMLAYSLMVYVLSGRKSTIFGSLKSQGKIEQPSLIILGQDDAFIDPNVWDKPERAFENISVQIIQHCSHWVPFDRPDEVNKLIKYFLQNN